jgi:hypothetical protein
MAIVPIKLILIRFEVVTAVGGKISLLGYSAMLFGGLTQFNEKPSDIACKFDQ